MHMGLESLESALKSASFDTKITSIASWEHIKPESTIHVANQHPVFTMEELTFHTIHF